MTRGQRRAVRPCVEHDPRVSRRSFHRATDRRERTRARPVTLARRARRDVPNMRPDRRRHALDGDALRRRDAAPHAREPSSLARGRHRRRAAPVGSARPPLCALGDPDRGNPRSRELRRRRWSPSCVGRAAPSAPRPGPLTVGRARDRRGGRAVVSRRRSVDPCAGARAMCSWRTRNQDRPAPAAVERDPIRGTLPGGDLFGLRSAALRLRHSQYERRRPRERARSPRSPVHDLDANTGATSRGWDIQPRSLHARANGGPIARRLAALDGPTLRRRDRLTAPHRQ
jgi:hypothetical protein